MVADTLPMQMQMLEDGLSHAQIGQRPFEMGYRSIKLLRRLVDGEELEDPIYTGLDVCEQSNATSCLQ